MKISTIIYFVADFIRLTFSAIFQAAFGLTSLIALDWASNYVLGHSILPNVSVWISPIVYIFIPCYIIVYFMSDIREFRKDKSL